MTARAVSPMPFLIAGLLGVLALVAFGSTSHLAIAQPIYSASYCDAYARDISWRYSRGGAIGGAARGAAGGAIIGGIVDGGHGARRGAAIGAIAGGTARGIQRGSIYDQAYHDCMRGYLRY